MFSVSSPFLLHLVLKLNNFTKSVFATPRDRLKNVDIAVLFLQKVLQANKIIANNKKIIRFTYPNFKKHVTGNTQFFLSNSYS